MGNVVDRVGLEEDLVPVLWICLATSFHQGSKVIHLSHPGERAKSPSDAAVPKTNGGSLTKGNRNIE